jgi:hypothetical protein
MLLSDWPSTRRKTDMDDGRYRSLRLPKGAAPSKDGRNFVQSMGSTSFICTETVLRRLLLRGCDIGQWKVPVGQ